MLHETHRKWIEARGIDPVLAEKLGLSTTTAGDGNWLSVPYVERGRVVNHKHRLTSEKRHRMDPGAPLTLWNHDCLLDDRVQSGQQPVIITEGEWDALAAMTAGFRHVVSVPNGAPSERTQGEIDPENDAKRFEFIWRNRDLLDRVGSFILATDGDEPGKVLAAELARRLGPERCRFVSYPEYCKDLNDVLLFDAAQVVSLITDAKPYPIKNIYRLSEFPDPPERTKLSLGIEGLGDLLPIVPASLTVVTGFAGAGKTSLLMAMMAAQLRRNVNVGVGSFETLPKPILQRRLRACLLECGEYQLPVTRIGEADRLIEGGLSVITNNANEDEEIDLDELLELCRVAVLRDGARVIVIDPWNEIEHKRRADEADHEYTGRAIRKFKRFMRDYDVALWIVVHPRKPDLNGTKLRMPSLYDASGSAHWANKADYGLVLWRPDKSTNVVEAHVTKVRMGYPGKEGVARLEYDFRVSSYRPAPDLSQ